MTHNGIYQKNIVNWGPSKGFFCSESIKFFVVKKRKILTMQMIAPFTSYKNVPIQINHVLNTIIQLVCLGCPKETLVVRKKVKLPLKTTNNKSINSTVL